MMLRKDVSLISVAFLPTNFGWNGTSGQRKCPSPKKDDVAIWKLAGLLLVGTLYCGNQQGRGRGNGRGNTAMPSIFILPWAGGRTNTDEAWQGCAGKRVR